MGRVQKPESENQHASSSREYIASRQNEQRSDPSIPKKLDPAAAEFKPAGTFVHLHSLSRIGEILTRCKLIFSEGCCADAVERARLRIAGKMEGTCLVSQAERPRIFCASQATQSTVRDNLQSIGFRVLYLQIN